MYNNFFTVYLFSILISRSNFLRNIQSMSKVMKQKSEVESVTSQWSKLTIKQLQGFIRHKNSNGAKILLSGKKEEIVQRIVQSEYSNFTTCWPYPGYDISEQTQRTRANAKENEELDMKYIVELLSSSNSNHKIVRAFREQIDKDEYIVRAYIEPKTVSESEKKIKPGNRRTHFDCYIDTNKRNGLCVEHKGSKDNKPIDPTLVPWHLGVQWHNGSPKELKVADKYLRSWYEYWIVSGRLSEKYQIVAPIPEYEVWKSRDAMVQGDPKTPYGKELKEKARERNGEKTSLMGERNEFMDQSEFSTEFTIEDLEELKQYVLEIANSCLQKKDIWLQITGNIHSESEDDYHVQWSGKCPIVSEIVDIKIDAKKNVDFEFICTDGFPISGIMRWGKGQGFSNFRFDLK